MGSGVADRGDACEDGEAHVRPRTCVHVSAGQRGRQLELRAGRRTARREAAAARRAPGLEPVLQWGTRRGGSTLAPPAAAHHPSAPGKPPSGAGRRRRPSSAARRVPRGRRRAVRGYRGRARRARRAPTVRTGVADRRGPITAPRFWHSPYIRYFVALRLTSLGASLSRSMSHAEKRRYLAAPWPRTRIFSFPGLATYRALTPRCGLI